MKNDTVSVAEDTRTSLSTAALKRAVLDHLNYSLGRLPVAAAPERSYYKALALTVRDRLQHLWIHTVQTYFAEARSDKVACYFSAEFLMGPQLGANLIDLNIFNEMKQAVAELGFDLNEVIAQEEEPGLGNGGLGRLASCYMD